MSFSEAVRTCLSKYLAFSGRARRPEFWWFVLFVFIGSVVFSLLDSIAFGANPETGQGATLFSTVFSLAIFLPYLAVGFRRMHDAGLPGWYLLLPLAVSIGMFLFLFVGVFAFGAMENAGADPDALRGPAAVLGVTGIMVAAVIQLALVVLLVFWLTRPSEPGENTYGPPV